MKPDCRTDDGRMNIPPSGRWEPKECVDCGRKLTLKDPAMSNYDHATGEAWTLCNACLLERRSAA